MYKFYFICATPRSGSSLLHSLLQSTQVAGFAKEFLHSKNKWNISDYKKTPNGVSGVKVMSKEIPHINQDEFLESRHLRIRRDNKILQSISLVRAVRTQQWVSAANTRQTPAVPIDISRKEINGHKNTIIEWEMEWNTFFHAHQILPFQVLYEDLMIEDNRAGIVREILDFLEIKDVPQQWPPQTFLVKQRDAWTTAVYDWYMKGKGETFDANLFKS